VGEVALGLQEGFVHQVGGAALGPEAGVQFALGQPQQVVAVALQRPAEGLGAAGTGRSQPLGDVFGSVDTPPLWARNGHGRAAVEGGFCR
jgi:hypothetical protein